MSESLSFSCSLGSLASCPGCAVYVPPVDHHRHHLPARSLTMFFANFNCIWRKLWWWCRRRRLPGPTLFLSFLFINKTKASDYSGRRREFGLNILPSFLPVRSSSYTWSLVPLLGFYWEKAEEREDRRQREILILIRWLLFSATATLIALYSRRVIEWEKRSRCENTPVQGVFLLVRRRWYKWAGLNYLIRRRRIYSTIPSPSLIANPSAPLHSTPAALNWHTQLNYYYH